MSVPFFSIILPCRNAAATLPAAIDSVLGQRTADVELIVVDGASTDGTAAVLAGRRDRLAVCLSEPDRGVYDAMNKGARLARGQWLLFLGADDQLVADDVLSRVQAAIGATGDGLFCGEAAYADGRVWTAPGKPSLRYRNFLHHQACFYHRSLFASGAGYDLTFPIQADYDFNLRLWQAGVPCRPLAVRVAVCGTGGLSDGARWANYRDEIRVRHRHFPAVQCWPWDAGSVLRFLRKKLLRTPFPHG